MNAMESRNYAERVLSTLGGLAAADALLVLNTAMSQVLSDIDHEPVKLHPPSPVVASLMQRGQGTRSRIETDAELLTFIQGLPASFTYLQIEAACRTRFGRSRAPSKSAIHRYIQRLKYPNGKQPQGGSTQ